MELKLIGISLYGCIEDIQQGVVLETEVLKIIAGTCAPTEEAWNELIAEYSTRWSNPTKAVTLVRRLRSEGRIEQPYLVTGLVPSRAFGNWVQSHAEIVWWNPNGGPPAWPEELRTKVCELGSFLSERWCKVFDKEGS